MRAWTCTAAIVLVVGLAWFGRAAWGGHFLVDESPGMDIYHLSTLYERWAHHLTDGHLPTWMPELGGGYAAPASWMYGLWYPGLLLFAVLPADLAWTWTALLHLVLGAIGMHRLVREETEDDVAGVTAGLLFVLSELMVGRILFGHLNVMMPIAWAPWVFLHLRGIADGRRNALVWCAVVTSLGLLSGHVQVWFYVVPAALAYAAVLSRDVARRGRYVRSLGVAALLVVLLTAIQWLPTLELFSLSERAAASTTDVTDFSAPLHVLVAKLFPGVLGHLPDGYWGPDPAVHELGGIGGLLLVVLALPALMRRTHGAWTWLGIAAAGLLLAPGVLNPISSLLDELPPVRFGRTPARALLLTTLGGAVLAGRGLAEWRRIAAEEPQSLRRTVVRATIVTALIGGAGVTLLFALLRDDGIGDRSSLVTRAVVTSVVLAGAAVALTLIAREQRWAWTAIPALAVATFALGGAPPARSVRSDFYFTDWARLMPAELQTHRVHLTDNRFPNVERQGLRTLREICYVDARWYHAFMATPGPRRAAWLDIGTELAGVPRERLMSGVLGADDLAGRPLQTYGAGQVFESARVGVDDEHVLAAIDAGERTLFLAAAAAELGSATSRLVTAARIARADDETRDDAPTEARFDVDSPVPGWLIVSEKHYPGWEATVNGAPVDIHRANVTFRAVAVPAGRSEVTFTYRPWSVRIGGLLCALGLLATLLAVDRSRSAAP